MWTEEIRQNLAKELNNQLDNKKFFDATKYYSSDAFEKDGNDKVFKMTTAPQKDLYLNKSVDIEDAIKGMAFSNKIPVEKDVKTVTQLEPEKLKIYKISDLISENLMEICAAKLQAKSAKSPKMLRVTSALPNEPKLSFSTLLL